MRKRRSLPGLNLTLGYTVLYLSLVVLLPLSALVVKSMDLSWGRFVEVVTDPRTLASYRLTFFASLAAAAANGLFGSVVAWVLVRYSFPGKRWVDAIVDLPFALPTAVSGIALSFVYSKEGWIGRWLYAAGIQSSFSRLGVMIALTFIGLPFVVRTLQPAIQDLDPGIEEAAATLGATRFQAFRMVILPAVLPALLTGFSMAFARALGEYGSVVFIAGNMPMKTEIASLLIISKLEQYDYAGAAAIGSILLACSFLILLSINVLQWWSSNRHQVKS